MIHVTPKEEVACTGHAIRQKSITPYNFFHSVAESWNKCIEAITDDKLYYLNRLFVYVNGKVIPIHWHQGWLPIPAVTTMSTYLQANG